MANVRASDLKKIFTKWSQGTLYNRLEMLGIRDNERYVVKMNNTSTVLYNSEAVELLKEQYLKEFTSNSENDQKELDEYIVKFLSAKDVSKIISNTKKENDKKTDNNEKNEKIEKNTDVKYVNDEYIKKNYVSRQYHNDIVESLKKQIAILEKQLEKETANNEKLVDTIKLREQKDVVIEQQNLVKLQQLQEGAEIKTIDTAEGNKKSWFMRIFSKKK